MSHRTNFNWEFTCPKFVDFLDTNALELKTDEADAYFESEHEFSFNPHNLSEGLKVESLFAEAENMASPITTPNRPGSSSSNYRTPEGDLESDEVFYTTRKSYSLRETECRRLKSIGASPYRIPGGTTTTGKKRSRRTPFQSKLIEENTKQLEEEEILAQNLKKALFLDDDNIKPKQPEESAESEPAQSESQPEKENSCQSPLIMNVTQGSNDYSMELMAVSQDVVSECVENVCSSDDSMSPAKFEPQDMVEEVVESTVQEMPVESTEVHRESEVDNYYSAVEDVEPVEVKETIEQTQVDLILSEILQEVCFSSEKLQEKQQPQEEQKQEFKEPAPVTEEKIETEVIAEVKQEEEETKTESTIPEIRVTRQVITKSGSTSSVEGHSKSSGGFNSDTCWTDVDDENAAGTSEPQEKRRRPLRRESFIKSSATLASTVKKADPQKRLYRLLSYTAPPKNKYRSLAELSKDFETKIRAYTPPNLKAVKAQWTPTKPVSPKLTACKRKRTLTCVSHKEQEENIALSIKKNTFKATPFNKKTYLSTVNVGVKRVDPKPTTKPMPFSFRSEKRIEARRSKVPADLFKQITSQSAKKI